jgi:hypothetical protein
MCDLCYIKCHCMFSSSLFGFHSIIALHSPVISPSRVQRPDQRSDSPSELEASSSLTTDAAGCRVWKVFVYIELMTNEFNSISV